MAICRHDIKQNIKALAIWSIILGGLIVMVMAIYPSFSASTDNIMAMYSSMGNFSEMFGLDKLIITSPIGFYGVEGGEMLSLGGGMFAAMIGIAALSREEQQHTAEFLLTHPVTRTRVFFEKLCSSLTLIVLINISFVLFGALGFALIGERFFVKEILLFHLALLLLMVEICLITFGISSFLSRSTGTGIGLGISVLLYFFRLLVNMDDKFEFLKYITPYQYSDSATIFSEIKLDLSLILIGYLIGIVFIIAGFIKYSKKDIAG